jgi:phage terminase small subunit
MSDPTENPAENPHHPSRKLSPKQADFLRFYVDPQGPAFRNATKAAEWAGYKGAPGSVQLSVQGHRTLKNPAVQKCLAEVLAEAGCTLERDAQVLSEAMGAMQTKYLLGKNDQLIPTPAQPNHAARLRAVELKHRLLGASRRKVDESIAAPASTGTTQQLAGGEALSPEHAEAIQEVAALSAPERVSLCEVLDADEKLANFEAPEQDRSDEQDE